MEQQRLGELTREMRERNTGRLAARYLRALVAGKGDPAAFAHSRRWIEAKTIETTVKAAVGAHTREDMVAALRTVGQDLAQVVRPLTIIGRLSGFRRVPPAIACVTQTSGAQAYWTDAGGPAPLSAGALQRDSLWPIRVTGISVIVEELALSSDPAADDAILRDLAAAIVQKIDETFLDPYNAGSPETLPRSVTHDAQQFVSSGSAVANIDADLRLLMNALSDGGSDLQGAAWILNPRSAGYLASSRGSGGSPSYPGLGVLGGTLLGLPALVSGSVLRVSSPQETFISLVDPSRIWLAESGEIELSVSKVASIEMSDAPTNNSAVPTETSQVSMFQTSSLAAKAVQSVNWRAVTAGSAAAVLTNVAF